MAAPGPAIIWEPTGSLAPEYSAQKNDQSSPVVSKTVSDPSFTEHHHALAPQSVSIDVIVLKDTANLTTTQVFRNNTENGIPQSTYVFSLPSGGVMTNLSCKVDAALISHGPVGPVQDTSVNSEGHLDPDHVASPGEQVIPECFTTSIGDIPAGTTVEIELAYRLSLKHHSDDSGDKMSLTIPASTFPWTKLPKSPSAIPPHEVQGFSLNIEVLESENVKSVQSTTHEIIVEKKTTTAKVEENLELAINKVREPSQTTLIQFESGDPYLGNHFILEIETESGSKESDIIPEKQQPIHKSDHMVLTIPNVLAFPNASASRLTEILFTGDPSGAEDHLKYLRSKLESVLKEISEGREFNVYTLESSNKSWEEYTGEYSKNFLFELLTYFTERVDKRPTGIDLMRFEDEFIHKRERAISYDVVFLLNEEEWSIPKVLDMLKDTRTFSRSPLKVRDHIAKGIFLGVFRIFGLRPIYPNQGGAKEREVQFDD